MDRVSLWDLPTTPPPTASGLPLLHLPGSLGELLRSTTVSSVVQIPLFTLVSGSRILPQRLPVFLGTTSLELGGCGGTTGCLGGVLGPQSLTAFLRTPHKKHIVIRHVVKMIM